MNSQEEWRSRLLSLLGELPQRSGQPAWELLEETSLPYGKLEKLRLQLNGIEPVPAYFLKPADAGDDPLPAVLYNHSHGGFYDVGKDELLRGAPYLQTPSYGEALCREGYAVLCIDHWAFGERGGRGRSEAELFKRMLWEGRTMWGMMMFDSMRAVDYLRARPDVDADRIATLGMSMGSTMAWWLAALDERIRAAVDMCSLAEYDVLLETGGYAGHGVYYFVPGLLRHFTAAQINELTVPRPHLSMAGDRDPFTPPEGLRRIDDALRQAYAEAGAAERWLQLAQPAGHEETAVMRREALAFLRRWL